MQQGVFILLDSFFFSQTDHIVRCTHLISSCYLSFVNATVNNVTNRPFFNNFLFLRAFNLFPIISTSIVLYMFPSAVTPFYCNAIICIKSYHHRCFIRLAAQKRPIWNASLSKIRFTTKRSYSNYASAYT